MRHVIRKQVMDIGTRSGAGYQLQQLARNYYYSEILPVLEKIFDELGKEHEVLMLDRLEIDIGQLMQKENSISLPAGDLYKIIRQQFELKIAEAATTAKAAPGTPVIKTQVHNAFDQWLYYMRHGVRPWNAAATGETKQVNVLETLATDYHSVAELARQIREHPSTALRIIRMHQEDFLVKLVEVITAVKQTELAELIQLLQNLIPGTTLSPAAEKIWMAVLKTATTPGKQHARTEQLLQQACAIIDNLKQIPQKDYLDYLEKTPRLKEILTPFIDAAFLPVGNQTNQPGFPEQEMGEKNISSEKFPPAGKEANDDIPFVHQPGELPEEGIFIQHAGLILLHPFFRFLFGNAQMMNNNAFVTREAQQDAVYLLHYIATGETTAEEHLLAMPKIICGWPLDEPVAASVQLTSFMLSEADDLVNAAIAQWTILKSTSAAGLREGFLQRSGKVFTANGNMNIHVEKNAIDVLLDHLPWNLSLVKLPWQKEIIRVDWR
jgi:Contractile injection system tape measure protein